MCPTPTPTPEPTPEVTPTPESTPSYGGDKEIKENTFHPDRRCLAVRPQAPQWAIKVPAIGGVELLWSAMGGSKVDIEITNGRGEYEYKYVLVDNNGHKFLPSVAMSQLVRVRVYNVCKYGPFLIDP